ncbi:type VI secretion system-associated FHA domain protein TagH [Erwinia tracheiphila]|uniref:Type VI secretion system-associated FHA domain protein TagH n=1 Tax=Erwinia tracheiphila TaxID=65700 RepID=A0A345CRD9_9GAMM|nr:type VI secretion system-associated FHA domain protein TagH [Erwinia tracheiphila]AXF76006.1 type VI secretion system-associated FHA domain protein TagH [Erwinia tracheiphila]UIA85334.1 type VI secretion system-associated FHA domain protein TagH [Erwinia tracheiphila]UIA93858.1 type VI secretion system-associated FHA domain protein TagH [Erwinia tracheiphila]
MRFTLVESKNGKPLTCCDFVAPGGTIGRSPDNDLVLPDEERAISRLQAVVHIASNGECRLTNHGSVTAVIHNRTPLARGTQILLQHNDMLGIGHYRIRVSDPSCQDEPTFSNVDPLVLFTQPDLSTPDPLGISPGEESVSTPAQELHTAEQLYARQTRQKDARLGINPVNHGNMHTERTAAPENEQRLLAALMEGMGLDHINKPQLTEDQMRTTGRMLSLFSQGTVALLSSRSILKRGVKAEMTMILNEANNPFKILPSGKTVLMQIYQSEMPGFMGPEQAVRDALVDLQAHQLGMISGIRAIIAAMLQSFHPQRLEEFARRDGNLPRISRGILKKAALWDYFFRHYQNMSGEIEDDFHTLFGNAFLQAYDMEVNQYKDSQTLPEEE